MKILNIDRQDSSVVVIPQNFDDLWQLQQIIQEHDIVSGTSERKVKPKEEGMKASKENIFVELDVEKAEFHKPSGQLRVLGTIIAGKPEEFVQLKTHHTIEIEPNKKIKIKKECLNQFEIDKLKKAEKETGKTKMLLVVMDDEQAEIAELLQRGFEKKAGIKSGKSGKRFKEEEFEKKYFAELLKTIKQMKFEVLVIAGPGFTKDSFKKYLAEKNEKFRAFFASINSVGITGMNELLKSPALEKIFSEANAAIETKTIDNFFVGLAKGNPVSVGEKETRRALELGAVSELLIEEESFFGNRKEFAELVKKAETQNAKIHFISAGHEAGQKLKGIGGIAAILRYKPA